MFIKTICPKVGRLVRYYIISCRLLDQKVDTPGWWPADCVWIQPRLRSCGWALASSWTRSRSETYRCCRPRCLSSIQHATSASSSTASFRWMHMLLLSVAVATTSYGNFVQWQVSADAAKTLLQAFISSRLDYCNALLYGVSDGLMCRLQLVQNAAVRLVTDAWHRDHITPILRQLHLLPMPQRVTFKVAVLVFQCMTGQAPAYLADDCQLTSGGSMRRLLWTDTAMCVVWCSNNSFGDRCFAAAGPRLWNTLAVHLRQCDSLGQFKRLLNTHLFGL